MTKGLYLEYSAPFVLGGAYQGKIDKFTSYNHEIVSMGGFKSASIAISLPMRQAEDWYEWGLGRVCRIFDQRGILAWKGFCNQVSINAGGNTETRGPLMDVKNRISATYTPRDFSVYPPVDGSQTVTLIGQDTTSQAAYGIIEEVISAGTTTETTANLTRDRFLQENSIPKTTGSLSISPGTAAMPTVRIDMLGNVEWLKAYIYDNPGVATSSTLSTKLRAILTADPNGIISTDYNFIQSNAYLVNDLEDKLRTAWDCIVELVSLGDGGASDLRAVFGIYDDSNRAYYNVIPIAIEYEHKLSNPRQVITSPGGSNVILPWMVRPGKWINVPDFLIGRNIPSTSLNSDPRNKFIDSVRFTSPYTVDISGGANDTLSQMLAKISYSGGIY